MEEWRDIEGYEGLYQVSNEGRVRSLDRIVVEKTNKVRVLKGKILKLILTKLGYYKVALSKNGATKHIYVHRLVANAFIQNPNGYTYINHKNEDKTLNTVENLEWCTNVYNVNYGTARDRAAKTHEKKTYQYTLDGELVGIYDSAKKAAEVNGFNESNISSCALGKGRKQHKGYRWSYQPL